MDSGLLAKKEDDVPHNGRFAYCGLFMVTATAALVVANVDPNEFLTKIPGMPTDQPEAVLQALAVMRLSFALVIFHLVHLVGTLGRTKAGDYRDRMQNGYWMVKVPVFVVVVVAAFAIPMPFYNIYDYFARVGGVIFILLQILILIDFAYVWNKTWVAYNTRVWYAAILVCAITLLLVGLVIIILLFVFYGGNNCSLNNFFVAMTLILGMVAVVGSMLATHGALLPSSVIVAYAAFLCWSAVNGVNAECDRLTDNGGNPNIAVLIVGAAFTILSLCYQSFSATTSEEVLSYKTIAQDENAHDSVPFFHFVFLLASFYLAMLLTGWRDFGSDEIGTQSVASMWVKMVSQWVVFALYIWSLAAPYVLKNRDFGFSV